MNILTKLDARRQIRGAWLVALSVALAAPLSVVGCRAGELSVDEIVARVEAAQAELKSTHTVFNATIDMPGLPGSDTITVSAEQWTDGDKMRMEYVDGPEVMKGTVMVMNGDTIAMYTPAANQFVEMPVPELTDGGAMSAQTAAMTREWVNQILKTNTVTLEGIEDVAGRRTFKLSAVPKETSEGGSADDRGGASAGVGGQTSTLWVDTETFYPLKLDLAAGPMHMTMTAREVEYNADVPPETFVLEAPPGAEKADVPLPEMESTTVEDAQAKVDFDLVGLEAGASDFVLQNTTVTSMPGPDGDEFSVVMQTYQGPSGTIAVQQAPALGEFDLAGALGGGSGGRTVEIGGHTASLMSLGVAGNILSWQQGDTQVMLSGQTSEEDLLAFAASLQ